MHRWKIGIRIDKIEEQIEEIQDYIMLLEEYEDGRIEEKGLIEDTIKVYNKLDEVTEMLEKTITMINISEETTRVEKAVIDKYVKELKEGYPEVEESTIRATCEQAIREGIRDVTIVWEWLQDEI